MDVIVQVRIELKDLKSQIHSQWKKKKGIYFTVVAVKERSKRILHLFRSLNERDFHKSYIQPIINNGKEI